MYHIEVTDIFGGDPNYSWVRRSTTKATTRRGIVRAIKAEMGITGERADVSDYGDIFEVRPIGRNAPCIVGFAEWRDDTDTDDDTV
jgi:hypothetical protein